MTQLPTRELRAPRVAYNVTYNYDREGALVDQILEGALDREPSSPRADVADVAGLPDDEDSLDDFGSDDDADDAAEDALRRATRHLSPQKRSPSRSPRSRSPRSPRSPEPPDVPAPERNSSPRPSRGRRSHADDRKRPSSGGSSADGRPRRRRRGRRVDCPRTGHRRGRRGLVTAAAAAWIFRGAPGFSEDGLLRPSSAEYPRRRRRDASMPTPQECSKTGIVLRPPRGSVSAPVAATPRSPAGYSVERSPAG